MTPICDGELKYGDDWSNITIMKPKTSNNEALISIRSIITADNEPHFFTSLFSGTMVVQSFDYLTYGESDEYGYVMMFQLIGVPHINQKAVEVPVSWLSLSTSGWYIMLANDNIFFWMGSDFNKFNINEYLISDEMLQKLNYIYEEEAKVMINDERTFHYILQGQETELFSKIITKEDECDVEVPNYESEIIYKNWITPKNPRFYWLLERDIIPHYMHHQINVRRHKIENENFLFKEYYTYSQLNLQQRGVYMINADSDAFIWIGSKVHSQNLSKVLSHLSKIVSNKVNIHFVNENYEPEVFIQFFPWWNKRASQAIPEITFSIEEIKEDNEDKEDHEDDNKSETSSNASNKESNLTQRI